jgi:NitT/TauT family transport system ATP-binding protein
MLEVRIRSKDFPLSGGAARKVLHNVSFAAAPGNILVLLGQSGIGKSTVLRIAMGLERNFEGSVSLGSNKVGCMFQEPRLLPWMSIEDNLRLVQRRDVVVPDIAALLDDVMLPSVEGLLPAALSLGMARRVALARALAVDPDPDFG